MLTRTEKTKVNKIKTLMFDKEQKLVKIVLKQKPYWAKDLNHHFKTDAWPINYSLLLEETKLPDTVFNGVLVELGYKVSFNSYNVLVITKRRKRNVV